MRGWLDADGELESGLGRAADLGIDIREAKADADPLHRTGILAYDRQDLQHYLSWEEALVPSGDRLEQEAN